MFIEGSKKANDIIREFEIMLRLTTMLFGTSFKSPIRDVARRFLNELKEFKPRKKELKRRIGDECL